MSAFEISSNGAQVALDNQWMRALGQDRPETLPHHHARTSPRSSDVPVKQAQKLPVVLTTD